MSFPANLRFLRRRSKCSQNKLADDLGYRSFTTIQKWEDGTAVPPYKMIERLAVYFGVTTDDLMNHDLSTATAPFAAPILGIVRGGSPIYADSNVLGYEHVSDEDGPHDGCFYLEVVGDSMKDARIMPGDLVYVHQQSYLDEGDIGVVMIGDEATIKKIHYHGHDMVLTPANAAYQPIILTPQDIERRHVTIVGKVLHDKIRF